MKREKIIWREKIMKFEDLFGGILISGIIVLAFCEAIVLFIAEKIASLF